MSAAQTPVSSPTSPLQTAGEGAEALLGGQVGNGFSVWNSQVRDEQVETDFEEFPIQLHGILKLPLDDAGDGDGIKRRKGDRPMRGPGVFSSLQASQKPQYACSAAVGFIAEACNSSIRDVGRFDEQIADVVLRMQR